MNNLKEKGLTISIFLGLFSLGLVIVGEFLFKEYITGIVFAYLLVMIVMWLIIPIITFFDRKVKK